MGGARSLAAAVRLNRSSLFLGSRQFRAPPDAAAAVRRHRGWAPCPGDLAHLPGTQPHHTVFSPGFLDIKKSERYTKTSSRIGASYYKK